jgi:hypothetical protein
MLVASWIAIAAISLTQTVSLGSNDIPPAFWGSVRPIEPSPQPGSWVLQIIGRQSIARRDRRLTLFSEGTFRTDEMVADGSVSPEALHLISQQVQASTSLPWPESLKTGICMDCPQTLMVLTLRGSSNPVQSMTAYWDVTTERGVRPDIRRLYELTLEASASR